MNRVVAAAMAAVLLAGCATTQPKPDTAATIASFQPGVTTIAQAEAALGQPFQATRMPDGSQKLQYVSKHQELAGDGTPTTGSRIPKRVEKTVSTMLDFDANGHFVSASSNTRTRSNSSLDDGLGHLDTGDVQTKGN